MKRFNFLIKKKNAGYFLYGLTSDRVLKTNYYTFQLIRKINNKPLEKLNREEKSLYRRLKKYGFVEGTKPVNVLYNNGVLEKMDLQITSRCNLHCRHCLWYKSPIAELKYDKIRVTLIDFKKLGGFIINITGGEPLLYKDILRVLKLCRELDFQITISTNGLLINESLINSFKEFRVAKVIVSLDGYKKSHEYLRGKNTFNRTVNNIELLVKNNIETSIRMMYYKKSRLCYSKFREFCKKLGVSALITAPIINMGSAKESRDLLLSKEELKRYYNNCGFDQSIFPRKYGLGLTCGAGKEFIYISSKGDVYPCAILFDFKLGNINKRRLSDIYKSPNKNFNLIKNFNYKNTVCNNCPKFKICLGGCRGRAHLNGNIYERDFFACAAYLKDF